MRRTHGNVYVLDDIDRQLVEILRADPRASNRSMAEAVGITDETVAARLRRMLETGAMAMTVVIDWRAAGYCAHGIARARFSGVTTAEAIKPLLDLDDVFAVAETTGADDAVINLLAPDLDHLHRFVVENLRRLDGLARVTVDVVSDVSKQSLGITTLPVPPWSPATLPAPVVPLDHLDHRILEVVASDAHESNREIARRLGVSDGTVRARLARMENAGLTRIVATVDPVTTGEIGAVAYAFLTVDGPLDPLVEHLTADPAIPSVSLCIGTCDVIALVDAATSDELHTRLSRDLRTLPGVRSVEVSIVVDVPHHRAHLGRLL